MKAEHYLQENIMNPPPFDNCNLIDFQEGSGLGKNKQGLTKALQVEKTSRRGGRIINGE